MGAFIINQSITTKINCFFRRRFWGWTIEWNGKIFYRLIHRCFPLDKSDFVRTRLTHSLEVSTIARQLGIMITQNTTQFLPEEFEVKGQKNEFVEKIPVALSCAGLLHDLGNPPFGHKLAWVYKPPTCIFDGGSRWHCLFDSGSGRCF